MQGVPPVALCIYIYIWYGVAHVSFARHCFFLFLFLEAQIFGPFLGTGMGMCHLRSADFFLFFCFFSGPMTGMCHLQASSEPMPHVGEWWGWGGGGGGREREREKFYWQSRSDWRSHVGECVCVCVCVCVREREREREKRSFIDIKKWLEVGKHNALSRNAFS
jgi:hypothetical protein